jgi:hypothetical protein
MAYTDTFQPKGGLDMVEYRLRSVSIRNFFTLSNIEFVPGGKHVRISGKTGAGKTTAVGAILYAFSSVDTKGHKRIPGASVQFELMGSECPTIPTHPALIFPQAHEGHPSLLIKEILYPQLCKLESDAKKIKSKLKFLHDMSDYLHSCEVVPPIRITNEIIELMRQYDDLSVAISQHKQAMENDPLFAKWNAYKDYHYLSYAEKVELLFDCISDIEDRLFCSFFKLVDDGERLSPSFIEKIKQRWQVIYTWKEYDKDLTTTVEG